jgi:hypothetical protein
MVNKARGFVAAEFGSETLQLALGLGALSEVEDLFGVESFEQAPLFAGERFTAKMLKRFFVALLVGNGYELTPERAAAVAKLTPANALGIFTELCEASGLTQAAETIEAQGEAAPLAESAGEPG